MKHYTHPLLEVEDRLYERAWFTLHQSGLRLIEGQRDGYGHLDQEVDPQDDARCKWHTASDK